MFGAISTATNSSFQKGMTFCRSTYVKKVMRLLAFIFEQSSYNHGKFTLSMSIVYLFVFDNEDYKVLVLLVKCLEYSLDARKPVFGRLRTTQAQTSLRIRSV